MTGRAAGFCAGNDEAGFASAPGGRAGRGWNRGAGRGRGAGFRRGSGYGRGRGEDSGYASGLPTKTELAAEMNAEVEALEQRIARLRREIDALDTENSSEDA